MRKEEDGAYSRHFCYHCPLFHKFSTVYRKIGGKAPFLFTRKNVTMKWGEVGQSGGRETDLETSVRWLGKLPNSAHGRVPDWDKGKGHRKHLFLYMEPERISRRARERTKQA